MANSRSMLRRALILLATFVACSASVFRPAATPPPSHFDGCNFHGMRARCGWVQVWEDRGKRLGRTIALRTVVIPATARKPGAPLYPLAGGPGQAVVEVAAGLSGSPFFRRVHLNHDVVLVDQRGTGGSHPLQCDLYPTATLMLRELFPIDRVRACRETLAADANLTMYGSGNAADDLDDVARALGHQKIVIWAGSYGTTLALEYLRRHPQRVQAQVLEGVAPPWLRLPLPFPRGAQRALDDLARACDADRRCHVRFPNFRHEFATLNAASEGGISVDYTDGVTHTRIHDVISHEVFADRIRQALYSSYFAAQLPSIVHDAVSKHDTTPLANLVMLTARGLSEQIAEGLNLSITCSEQLAFITPQEALRESEGTFMGDSRYRAQRAACDVWDVPPENHKFLDPIPSSVPVLMISGSDDPATPPEFGAQELRYLPNGRQILIPGAGHEIESTCVDQLEAAVVDGAAPKSLDIRCVKRIHRPPFAT